MSLMSLFLQLLRRLRSRGPGADSGRLCPASHEGQFRRRLGRDGRHQRAGGDLRLVLCQELGRRRQEYHPGEIS